MALVGGNRHDLLAGFHMGADGGGIAGHFRDLADDQALQARLAEQPVHLRIERRHD